MPGFLAAEKCRGFEWVECLMFIYLSFSLELIKIWSRVMLVSRKKVTKFSLDNKIRWL